jgi:glycosyltransferase involved in cell wall biosynthesis
MAKRRLLLAAQPLDGGVARHVISLVESLPQGRFDVTVACPRGSATWAALADRPGVELRAIGHQRRPSPRDLSSLLTLLKLVRRSDVVHGHSAKAGFLVRLAAKLAGKTRVCVFTPHGWSFWPFGGFERRLYLRLERLAASWCRAIVVLSAAEREAGLREGLGDSAQYRLIPNGIELGAFARRPAPASGRIVLLGRLSPPKRPDLAIRAVAELQAGMPEAELHVVGRGPLEQSARRLAAELGVSDSVRFLGSRDDVGDLLAEAACLLLASDYEACPMAVVEAMAAGVPVVATAIPGIDELVQDGRTGLIAPHDDPGALAAALREILTDGPRGRELGAAGRRVAHERLSIERMVERLTSLYEDIDPGPATGQ